MHAVGIDGKGNIDPVVDEKLCTISVRQSPQLICQAEKLSGAEALLPQLDSLTPLRVLFRLSSASLPMS